MKKMKLLVLLMAITSMGLYTQEKEEGKIVLKKVGTEAVPGVVVSAVTDVEDNRKQGD